MLPRYDRDSLVPVSSLPDPFQPIFKYRYFNAVQSESFSEAYLSDGNMVVSAPTGSGKTGLFELCILRLLSRAITPDGRFHYVRGSQKIVYIGPMKALVQEVSREWDQKFGQVLGLVCQELTGDSNVKASDMQETDIILTTPEKFDSITRHHRDHGGVGFFGDIALLLIDEVHLLNDSRGAALEAVVSRIKMLGRYPELKGSPIASIRYVAVSATIPNIEDIAEWLRVPRQGIKRFGEEMRPVKLTTKVYGYAAAKNDFLFEKRLQNFLFDIIVQHSKGKPALVFCCTRKGAQDAALILAETVSKPGARNPFIKSQEQFDRLKLAATGAVDKNMHTCIASGVAYHNGGLGAADRALVEGLFLKSDLQVLCTTSTLAQGVNLPAHLVVIKSTQFFLKSWVPSFHLLDQVLSENIRSPSLVTVIWLQEKGRYVEHERSTLLQMCGRAGRPQFDDSGMVVLMTRNETVHLYENILSGSEPVESELLPSIAEHLNAEIVLMTVSDVGLAIDWLKCSYLYVRMRKHPQHYKIERGITEEQMEKHMKGICLQTVNELAEYGMVLMDEYGFTLTPLEPGRLMAKYYLNFGTMKTITEILERSTMADLLNALAKAEELTWIQLRRHEKKLLNAINQDSSGRIKFHVLGLNGKAKKRIQTYDEKIVLLINDVLSDEPSTLDFTMSQDVNGICTNGARIARCMGEYFKFMKRYQETKNSMLLAKCFRQRLWDDSTRQLKQLPGIGAITVKTFQTAGIDSFEKLASADPRHLESITGRRFPYGDQVKDSLVSLPPKVDLAVRGTGLRVGGKNEYTLELTRITQPKTGNKWHMADLIVGDDSKNQILFHERISPYPIGVYSTSSVSAALICEEYVGMDILNKTADGSKPSLAVGSTRSQMAQQRERKKESLQKQPSVIPVSSQKQPSINQMLERRLELPQLRVGPKCQADQDHNISSQNSCTPTMQLSNSVPATAASRVADDGTGIADCPIGPATVSKVQDRTDKTDIPTTRKSMGAGNVGEPAMTEFSPDHASNSSRVYNEGVTPDSRSLPQECLQDPHAENVTFLNDEARHPQFSTVGPHAVSSTVYEVQDRTDMPTKRKSMGAGSGGQPARTDFSPDHASNSSRVYNQGVTPDIRSCPQGCLQDPIAGNVTFLNDEAPYPEFSTFGPHALSPTVSEVQDRTDIPTKRKSMGAGSGGEHAMNDFSRDHVSKTSRVYNKRVTPDIRYFQQGCLQDPHAGNVTFLNDEELYPEFSTFGKHAVSSIVSKAQDCSDRTDIPMKRKNLGAGSGVEPAMNDFSRDDVSKTSRAYNKRVTPDIRSFPQGRFQDPQAGHVTFLNDAALHPEFSTFGPYPLFSETGVANPHLANSGGRPGDVEVSTFLQDNPTYYYSNIGRNSTNRGSLHNDTNSSEGDGFKKRFVLPISSDKPVVNARISDGRQTIGETKNSEGFNCSSSDSNILDTELSHPLVGTPDAERITSNISTGNMGYGTLEAGKGGGWLRASNSQATTRQPAPISASCNQKATLQTSLPSSKVKYDPLEGKSIFSFLYE